MISFQDHGFGRFTAQRLIPPCCWDRYDLLCVHEGRLQLHFEQVEPLELPAGTGVLIYPLTRFEGKPITASCHASVQHFTIEPDASVDQLPVPFRGLARKKHGFELRRLRQDSMVSLDIERAIRFAFERPSKQLHDLRVALLTLILGQLEPTEDVNLASGDQWQALTEWLRRRMHEPLAVEHMAQHCGLSASHFRSRFRQVFGLAPGRYLQRIRLQEAERLLRESDMVIKSVAQQVGYDDLPNFYRAFRQQVGCTPGQYRRQFTPSG